MDQKDLIRLIDEAGWGRDLTGSGHYAVRNRQGRLVATISKSPHKGSRSLKNTVSTLRKAGLRIPR